MALVFQFRAEVDNPRMVSYIVPNGQTQHNRDRNEAFFQFTHVLKPLDLAVATQTLPFKGNSA
jgi:hypothetical protein